MLSHLISQSLHGKLLYLTVKQGRDETGGLGLRHSIALSLLNFIFTMCSLIDLDGLRELAHPTSHR